MGVVHVILVGAFIQMQFFIIKRRKEFGKGTF